MAGCVSRRFERGIQRETEGVRGHCKVGFLFLGSEFVNSCFLFSPIMQRLYGAAGGAPRGAGGFPGSGFPGGAAPGGFPGAHEEGPSVEEVD